MGKEVEKICHNRKHKVICVIDNANEWNNLPKEISNAVIIDFSLPETVITNIKKAFRLQIPIVTGTTGWHDNILEITRDCEEMNGALFYAPNFSIGVNLFLKANNYLASLVEKFNNYSASIHETHHIHKVDSPSGTAISIANEMIKDSDIYNSWQLNQTGNNNSIPIFSYRQGEVTGKHTVKYDSDVDSIAITHEAKNRSGFALGAVMAAEFIMDKKGVFTMNDLLNNM